MAHKHPKSSRSHNPTAKSLQRWENEGGAPRHRKRPRDANQLNKMIVDIATGQVVDREATDQQERDPAAVARDGKGGQKSGKARAETLSPSKRKK
jgi:hypothetical protein